MPLSTSLTRMSQLAGQLSPKAIADPGDGVRDMLVARLGRQRMEGKVCIITGANSLKGIGRATAIAFAQNGAKAVYVTDFDSSNLVSLASEISSTYPSTKAIPRQLDAAEESEVKGICDLVVSEFGRLDVFFANAGIGGGGVKLTDISVEAYNRVMRVNALGPFLACKHAFKAMQVTSADKPAPGGSIVVTASIAGLRGGVTTAYGMSKAAVINLCQSAAWQFARTGVRVNALCPGFVETGLTERLMNSSRKRNNTAQLENPGGFITALGRYAIPEEMAATVVFLASDDASYVTGQAWAVDGGVSASLPMVSGKS